MVEQRKLTLELNELKAKFKKSFKDKNRISELEKLLLNLEDYSYEIQNQ